MKKSSGQIARRYSRAILDSCKDGGEVGAVLIQLENAERCLTGKVLSFLSSPIASFADKSLIVDQISSELGLGKIVSQSLKVILENGRYSCFPEIVQDFRTLSDARTGILRVEVVSATALTDADAQKFESELNASMKKKIVLTKKIDSALKAGYVIRVGDIEIDVSLRAQLNKIKIRLKDSMNQGV